MCNIVGWSNLQPVVCMQPSTIVNMALQRNWNIESLLYLYLRCLFHNTFIEIIATRWCEYKSILERISQIAFPALHWSVKTLWQTLSIQVSTCWHITVYQSSIVVINFYVFFEKSNLFWTRIFFFYKMYA